MEKTPETDANIAPLICKRPGCTTQLGPKNRIGLCPRHVRWTGIRKERPSRGNGHAGEGSNGANGDASDRGENGRSAPDPAGGFLEARIDLLLLNLPAADKSRIAQRWLRGEI